MTEYWIISAPGDKTPQQTFDKLNQETGQRGSSPLSRNFKFNIPELKVGTIDSLLGLSDDLGKLDAHAEGVCQKVANYLSDVLEEHQDKLDHYLRAGEATLSNFMHHFQWNVAKYPTKLPLRTISDIIAKLVSQVDTDLRAKSHSYNNLKTNLMNMEKKATGSILMRNLTQIVKKDDVIVGSEYLQSVLVVVPKAMSKDWVNEYENLTEYVAPRSARLIYEDEEYGLWSVTIFKKVFEEFKYNCGRYKFFVREFQYNDQESNSEQDQLNKLNSDKKRMLGPLLRWLKVNFSEVFIAWMHVKALRIFVESVLRYGLPVNFQAMVVQPLKKNRQKLRETLNNMYKDLDSTGLSAITDEDAIPGLTLGMQEYYAYVYYKVIIDFGAKKH